MDWKGIYGPVPWLDYLHPTPEVEEKRYIDESGQEHVSWQYSFTPNTLTEDALNVMIDELRTQYSGTPMWIMSTSKYERLQAIAQGKKWVHARRRPHKSLARMGRALRQRVKRERFMKGSYWYKVEALDADGRMIPV